MCLAGNPTLKRAAAGLMEPMWKEYRQTGKRPQERYVDWYGSRSWKQNMQAGLALQAGRQPKANPRFVVTNVRSAADLLSATRWRTVSRNSRQGSLDRASCTSFYANQFRVLLSAAAYALLQELRWPGDPLRQDTGGRAATVPAEAGGVGEEFDASGQTGGPFGVGEESGSGADLEGPVADCGDGKRGGSVPNGVGNRMVGASHDPASGGITADVAIKASSL